MSDIHIVFDDAVIHDMANVDHRLSAAVDRFSAGCVSTMKLLCPVSPVGPFHRSGNLRSSIHAFRQPDGDVIVGPTADYARYVNDGTYPHLIESHGTWSLHNRETGQYFGRVVHHPGTVGSHYVERTAESVNGTVIHIE